MVDETDVRAWVKDEVARQLKDRDTSLRGRPLIDPVPVIDAIERCFFDGDGKLFVTALFGLGAMATILTIILHLT